MKDDYLWNKSGEPDPEIEQLEQLLGTLSFRRPPGDLSLPQLVTLTPRRRLSPALAIAAALLFMMVAAGVWFSLGSRNPGAAAGILAENVEAGNASDWLPPEDMSAMMLGASIEETSTSSNTSVATTGLRPHRPRQRPQFNRRQPAGMRTAKSSPPRLDEQISNDEGVAAREQLIKALYLASSKLNQVQKKIQDSKNPGPVS